MADEPKIFIDEDWKARAQREKEELQKRAEDARKKLEQQQGGQAPK